MKYISKLSITNIESILLHNKRELELCVLSGGNVITVRFTGILHLNLSNDPLERDNDVSVVDVYHEYRKINNEDMKHYHFTLDFDSLNSSQHVVRIDGDSIIEVICDNIIIENNE